MFLLSAELGTSGEELGGVAGRALNGAVTHHARGVTDTVAAKRQAQRMKKLMTRCVRERTAEETHYGARQTTFCPPQLLESLQKR